MISTTQKIEPLPFRRCSDVTPRPINWLWKPYIPRGAMTMIIGDGGYGKSFMTCALAADLSAGRALPGQDPMRPQKILMVSAEDGLDHVIYPRLAQLDARLENIMVFDEGFTVNPKVSAQLAQAVDQYDAAVVFIDPMVVYLGGEVDFFKANEVRGILSQLTAIAKEKDIAIVCVHHVKKSASSGQHKSLGSVDFVNGVRSTLLVDCSKSGTYFMSHEKANWSAKGPTLSYSFNHERFYWMGLYEPSHPSEAVEISKTPRGKAKTFLINILKDGPVPQAEVVKLGRDEGMNEGTLKRAKVGICHSFRKDEKWYWELHEAWLPHPEGDKGTLKALAAKAPGAIINAGLIEESEVDRLVREARERMTNGQNV